MNSEASTSLSVFRIKNAKIIAKAMTYLKKPLFIKHMNESTLIGWIRSIDEKNPVRRDVNHFWVFRSPNSIPRTIIKNMDIIAKINDRP